MAIKLSLDSTKLYILAVSGGMDSMVLFDLFIQYKYNFVVVHFNHQKRTESIKDHELVQSMCLAHQIPYHYIKLNIDEGNFQEISRNKRYEHLENIASKLQTNYIVTAHHLDDLAETILMRFVRGSNLLGYAAIQPKTVVDGFTYLRPLLNYSKDDIKAYQAIHNVAYLEDHTNLEDNYLRNRIRHHIIPLLKKENDVLSHFKNFSTQSFLAADFIRYQTKSFLNLDLSFKLDAFMSLHKAVQMDVISFILEKINVNKTFVKISMIIEQLNSNKPNIDITLSKKFHMIKAYNDVYIHNINGYNMESVPLRLMISHNKADLSKNFIELCYNKLDFPIHVRKRQKGDKLHFTFGSKKLKDFLIDKKIPLKKRNELNIVVDSSGTILWIPELYLNKTLGNEHKIYISLKE